MLQAVNPLPKYLQDSPDSDAPKFVTHSLPLAASLIAADVLTFLHMQFLPNGQPMFSFSDPHEVGPQRARDFANGTFPLVNPALLLEVRSCLTNEMRKVKNAKLR